MRGGEIATARTMAHTFQIVEVLVVAVNTPTGFSAAAPTRFFTLVQPLSRSRNSPSNLN